MNGKLRTHHGAHLTANALAAVGHVDDTVSPAVGLVGLVKDVLRAKLDAKSAPFAPLLHHVDVVMAGVSRTSAQDSPVIISTPAENHAWLVARAGNGYGNQKSRITHERGGYQMTPFSYSQ
jgi:hypothetical protein